ncbi:hypothetical protein ACFL1H_02785 [Nanoarchaeota archaeon]
MDQLKAGFRFCDKMNQINYSDIYQEFTGEVISKWEEAVEKNPDCEYNCNKVKELLPFVKKVKPRVGQNQSLFGLSIISLDRKYQNEKDIVEYGLEPLVNAQILNKNEVNKIVTWYLDKDPSVKEVFAFHKVFNINGDTYELITDCYRGFRDLNLRVANS